METACASKRQIFISGNILNEVFNAIMLNGLECTIAPNGDGFTITYDDNNIRFLDRLLKAKQKEYDDISKKVYDLKKESVNKNAKQNE